MRCPKFTLADAVHIMPKVRLPRGVTPRQFLVGINVEREHKDVVGCRLLPIARVSAIHFWEGKDYYVRLLSCVERRR